MTHDLSWKDDWRYRSHVVRTSSLGRVAAEAPMTDEMLRDLAARAWRERGVVIVLPDQAVGAPARAMLDATATKLYGERHG